MKKIIVSLFMLFSIQLFASSSKDVVEEIASIADIKINGDRIWDIKVHNERFYDRVLKDQSLGLGESYMNNDWDSDAIDVLIYQILRADLEKKFKPTWSHLCAYL